MFQTLKVPNVLRVVTGCLIGLLVVAFGFAGDSVQERRYGSAVRTSRVRAQRPDSGDLVHHGVDDLGPVVALDGGRLPTPAATIGGRPRATIGAVLVARAVGITRRPGSTVLDWPTADVWPLSPTLLPARGRAPPAA